MHITLGEEWFDGRTDLVVESRHNDTVKTDRFALDMDSQRIELHDGEQGIVLIATYAPVVPTDLGHQLALAVGLIPLFGDNRPLPQWPMTWQAEGASIRFGIECPDTTIIEITAN